MEKYKKLTVIGDGTYGQVIKAINLITGEVVAIKKMKKKIPRWDHCIELKEVKSLIKLMHPNIVRLIEVIKEKNELHFVFEYLDVNVYQLITERQKPLPETSIRNIVYQTLQGLAYIHKNGYFHRDMKPENLLCALDYVKIADFGLAKEITAQPPFTDYVATRWYRAPEVILRSTTYNAPIDIFAVGAIMAELYTMRPLFPGSSEIDQMNKICQVLGSPTRESWPEGFKLTEQPGFKFPSVPPTNLRNIIQTASDSALDLIAQMLRYDPSKRPSAAECLQHEYFQVRLPIPLSVASGEREEETKKVAEDKSSQEEETAQPKPLNRAEERIRRPRKIKVTSKELMQNARYRPGVKPLAARKEL